MRNFEQVGWEGDADGGFDPAGHNTALAIVAGVFGIGLGVELLVEDDQAGFLARADLRAPSHCLYVVKTGVVKLLQAGECEEGQSMKAD